MPFTPNFLQLFAPTQNALAALVNVPIHKPKYNSKSDAFKDNLSDDTVISCTRIQLIFKRNIDLKQSTKSLQGE